MILQNYPEIFAELGRLLKKDLLEGKSDQFINKAYYQNNWFTYDNIHFAIDSICNHFLDFDKLCEWIENYDLKTFKYPKKIGIVMAANIPLVGFHDLLCVLLSGNHAKVKLSARDKVLPVYMIDLIFKINPLFKEKIEIVEKLSDFDAIIATGSNNTLRYFEYYFGKYPSIIRGSRTSLAVLDGNETDEELTGIGRDIFTFFGLGCRNVSALLVPQAYDFKRFFQEIQTFDFVKEHNKYFNNYEYNKSLLLLNKEKHMDNGFLLLIPSDKTASPMACLYYNYYENKKDLIKKLSNLTNEIQCIVSSKPIQGFKVIPPGKSQIPSLSDYADNIDTMEFLLGI